MSGQDELEQDAANIAAAQGWRDDTLGQLALRFLGEQPAEVQQAFLGYLRDAAQVENEG